MPDSFDLAMAPPEPQQQAAPPAPRAPTSFDLAASPPSDADRVGREMRLAETRQRYPATEGEGGMFFVRRSLPFGSAAVGLAERGLYNAARKRYEEGKPTDEDFHTIARFEQLQKDNAGFQKSFGGELATAAAGLPAILGEAAAGGAALRGAGLFAQALPKGAPLAQRAGRFAAQTAATTPLMPSMYAEKIAQNQTEKGGELYDVKNLAPALAHGMLNVAVLGAIQKGFNAVENPLKRVAAKGLAGVVEQQAADTVAYASGLDTKYGVMEDLLNGRKGEGLQHATVQALTFAAFAALHGKPGERDKILKDVQETLDQQARSGVTPDKAAEKVTDDLPESPTEAAKSYAKAEEKAQEPEQRPTPGEGPRSQNLAPETPKTPEKSQISDPLAHWSDRDVWDAAVALTGLKSKGKIDRKKALDALERGGWPPEVLGKFSKAENVPPAEERYARPAEVAAPPERPQEAPQAAPEPARPPEPAATPESPSTPAPGPQEAAPAPPQAAGPIGAAIARGGLDSHIDPEGTAAVQADAPGGVVLKLGDRLVILKAGEADPRSVDVSFDFEQARPLPPGERSVAVRGQQGEQTPQFFSSLKAVVGSLKEAGLGVEYSASTAAGKGKATRATVYEKLLSRAGFEKVEERPAGNGEVFVRWKPAAEKPAAGAEPEPAAQPVATKPVAPEPGPRGSVYARMKAAAAKGKRVAAELPDDVVTAHERRLEEQFEATPYEKLPEAVRSQADPVIDRLVRETGAKAEDQRDLLRHAFLARDASGRNSVPEVLELWNERLAKYDAATAARRLAREEAELRRLEDDDAESRAIIAEAESLGAKALRRAHDRSAAKAAAATHPEAPRQEDAGGAAREAGARAGEVPGPEPAAGRGDNEPPAAGGGEAARNGLTPEQWKEQQRQAREERQAAAKRERNKKAAEQGYKTEGSLAEVVKGYGGIDPQSHSLKTVYSSSKEATQDGVPLKVFKKGGQGLDAIAQEMYQDGHLPSPDPEALLAALKNKGRSLIDQSGRGEFEAGQERHYREQAEAEAYHAEQLRAELGEDVSFEVSPKAGDSGFGFGANLPEPGGLSKAEAKALAADPLAAMESVLGPRQKTPEELAREAEADRITRENEESYRREQAAKQAERDKLFPREAAARKLVAKMSRDQLLAELARLAPGPSSTGKYQGMTKPELARRLESLYRLFKPPEANLPEPPPSGENQVGGVPARGGPLGVRQANPAGEFALAREKVTQEREARGREEVERAARRSNETGWRQADATIAQNPNAGYELVNRLEADPQSVRPDADVPLLLLHRVALSNLHDKAVSDYNQRAGQFSFVGGEMRRTATEAELEPLRRRAEDLALERDRLDRVTAAVGTQLGRGLQYFRQLAREDYSLGGMFGQARFAKGGEPLTPAETVEVAKAHQEVTKADKALSDAERQVPDSGTSGVDLADLRIAVKKARRGWADTLAGLKATQQTATQKVIGNVREGLNASRSLITSMDFSAVFRQGGFLSLGHPVRALKALPDMFRAFASRQSFDRQMDAIDQRPNAELYKRSGLYLADVDGRPTAQEEAFVGRLARKVPGVAASERAYVAFLNRLRADTFDSMVAGLSRGGRPTVKEAQAVANFVNVATGRGGLGPLENAAQPLAQVFFSPRYVASRFQILAGQPLYNGSAATRKLVAQEYARFLAGVGVFTALALAADDKARFTLDPRSSDFGKIRMGNTRIDPLTGLGQAGVFLTRVGTGQRKTLATGQTVPIRGNVPYGGQTVQDVASQFVRGKLAPIPGVVADVAVGKSVTGEKVTAKREAGQLLVPMAGRDVVEALEDQGVPRGAAAGLLGVFGMGAQTFTPGKK